MTLVCAPCGRRGVYNVARLMAKHGDAGLTDLRIFLSADCPRRATGRNYDQCKALFEKVEYRRE